jgi:light-regulated signal transduction histidine kinase (bacteriophytochrome)
LGKKGGKVMAGFSITHVVYFYFVTRYTDWVDYSIIGTGQNMIDLDFLITGVLSILLLTALANYIEKSKNAIISDIRHKRDELAVNNAILQNTQKDLEIKNKELEQKNLELEQFAYVSSHDLQEPLRTISDFVGLLQQRYKGKLDDKADKYLSFITQSSDRMKTLIKDLLHYSQIGSEKRYEPVNCTVILNEVMVDIGKILKETKAEIQSGPLPSVTADPTGIKQLFQNLIINAVKFRKKDSMPEIKISAQKKGLYWEFSFTDNGIGIDKEHNHKIFNIFQRLNSRKEYAGSGIGLSHCRKIVELHGGKIWVKSIPGEGSTFHFTIHD